jgi:hypothetical protein
MGTSTWADECRRERALEDTVDDARQQAKFGRAALEPADQRDPALVDPVAHRRQQRRQHGHRPEHRHGDDEDAARREGHERRILGQIHPAHRDHHGETGDEHRALLSFPAQIEQRVVDADREADEQDDLVDLARDRIQPARNGNNTNCCQYARDAQQQRDAGGDDRPGGDHEDEQRQGQRGRRRAPHVPGEHLVELLLRARLAVRLVLDRRAGPRVRRDRVERL